MLNEERIILMTKLASYEQKKGKNRARPPLRDGAGAPEARNLRQRDRGKKRATYIQRLPHTHRRDREPEPQHIRAIT